MPTVADIPPMRRPELLLCRLDGEGRHVVKDPQTRSYYNLGAQEAFLLSKLDGQQSAADICAAFEARFGQPLSEAEFGGFVKLASVQGLLASVSSPAASTSRAALPNLLYWRRRIFDPDRLLTWLEPKLRICWTRGFLAVSLACIAVAAVLLFANHHELVTKFRQALRWETAVVVWVVLMLVTTLHEFAHGLTCKHHGGEVHEIGLLLIFLILPGLYCNVSDAWLFREKSKRLWVTFAGGYFDLLVWALAVLVWRLTLQDLFVNYLALVVLSVCGIRILFNFNPLLKLDGYYLLGDLLEIPNLQPRAHAYLKTWLRRLLWGAPRPSGERRAGALLVYGLTSWLFSLTFLGFAVTTLVGLLSSTMGLVGAAIAFVLGALLFSGLVQGFLGGEIRKMIRIRRTRTVFWSLIACGLPAGLFLGEWDDRASGSFHLRSAVQAELHAPVAGFLQSVNFDEGSPVAVGEVVFRLEVPNLVSRLTQKRAERREVEAHLRLLEVGPRPEEVAAQRRRVERAESWRDLAQRDLERAQKALDADLARLDQQIAQYRAELDFAQDVRNRSGKLYGQKVMATEHFRDVEKRDRVTKAQFEQVEAQRQARRALGNIDAEAELARREKELAEARATLTLLEAGTRYEEIDAERAHLDRIHEEVRYLETLQEKTIVKSPAAGVITTPRLRESVGRYFREGEVICAVEDPARLEAEIALTEREVTRVRQGQRVELKVQALPFDTFAAEVDRIAPRAVKGEITSTITVYSRLENAGDELRPGMTGHARISCGRRAIGAILCDGVLRYVRAEFW